MTTPHTAPEAPKAPEAPNQPGTGSLISFPAIIVAALGAATVALISPYLKATIENTVVLAMFISVATTTSTAIYKACVEKFTSGYRGRRWTSILLAGLLAGLIACFVGLAGLSGAEVAMGKEPSILAPLSAPPSAPPSVPLSDSDRSIVNYYEDVDHDMLGAGPPHPQGQQPLGWVANNSDQCPLQPGSSENAGCPLSNIPEAGKGIRPNVTVEAGSEIPPEAPLPRE